MYKYSRPQEFSMPDLKWRQIEEAGKRQEEMRMAEVVAVKELAEFYNVDRSSFTRRLKKNRINIFKMYDPHISQRISVIHKDDVDDVRELYEPEHEIVSVEEAIDE